MCLTIKDVFATLENLKPSDYWGLTDSSEIAHHYSGEKDISSKRRVVVYED